MTAPIQFAPRGGTREVETGAAFTPKFDAAGLIPAIATDAATGDVLMFAFMNEEALRLTLTTREAHFYSRSRKSLWRKGEISGNVLNVAEVRTDCDQDVIWLRVTVSGDGAACHTGKRSCFYRQISVEGGSVLLRLDEAAATDERT